MRRQVLEGRRGQLGPARPGGPLLLHRTFLPRGWGLDPRGAASTEGGLLRGARNTWGAPPRITVREVHPAARSTWALMPLEAFAAVTPSRWKSRFSWWW